RRDELRRYVAKMRAKILKIEIDVKQSYLENLIETRAALPFGAREFFATRMKRLEEISGLLRDAPGSDGGADDILGSMRKMLQHLMDQAPQLEVFERDPDWRPPARSGSAPRPAVAAPAAPRRQAGPATPEIKPIRLTGRDEWGRVFLDKGSFDTAYYTSYAREIMRHTDASKLVFTRGEMSLIFKSQDTLERNMLDVLHNIINNHTGATTELG